jgi:hypothetical protein
MAQEIEGNVPSGSADGGNPLKVGGKYNSTLPTFTDGQRGDLQVGTRGSVHVSLKVADSSQNVSLAASNSDALAAGAIADRFQVLGLGYGYDGSTNFNRWRNNNDITVAASLARTATGNSGDLTNYNARGLHLYVDVTAASATPSVVFTIQGKDAVSGAYYTILASAAVTGVSSNIYKVYPGLTAAANLVASDILPRTYRILWTHSDADSITYSIGASLIL